MKMSDAFKLPLKVDRYLAVSDEYLVDGVYPTVDQIESGSRADAAAICHAINNHDALVKSLEELLDYKDSDNECRFVRECCQEHFDFTGDGSCYVDSAKKVLAKAKGDL